jgi:hypothetical protein
MALLSKILSATGKRRAIQFRCITISFLQCVSSE